MPGVSEVPGNDYQGAIHAARRALRRGEQGAARRFARIAVGLHPEKEAGWLMLAAASTPRAAQAYVQRALQINPQSEVAQRALTWVGRRLGEEAPRGGKSRISGRLRADPASLEVLARRRLFSPGFLLLTVLLPLVVGAWLSYQPAQARPADSRPLAAPPLAVLKATDTPTPTSTPTATPTATPTPTPTNTPTPTPTNTPTPTRTPTPRPTSTPRFSWTYVTNPKLLANEGHWLDIDLSEQRLTAYNGETAVKSFIVSTGKSQTPTVTGQFRIWIKLRYDDMAGPGYYLADVPYTMYFYKGYAVHGTYWHSNFGTPMSHGCVNLRTSDAEWVYNFSSVGTLVNVHP